MIRSWSPLQTNVFNFAESGEGNAIVEAVAGSGKTTTIVEALKRVTGSTLFLAFNKSIATELKNRGVNARTFHSLTYSAVTRHKNVRDVNGDKLRDLVDGMMTEKDAKMYGRFACRLVSLAKQVGIGIWTEIDQVMVWRDLVDHFDLELDDEKASYSTAVEYAQALLEKSNASHEVDFDDLLYVAVRDGLVLPKFDFVFVDEAQDTNALQRAILRKVMKPGARLIAVGDPAQAIYGFRGADSESLATMAKEFACIRLPLTVSYRCPTAIVEHARQWVSHIEAAPNAPAGEVRYMGTEFTPATFQPQDLVVCRTAKPLVSLAFQLFKARVPAHIMGREIGQGLKALIARMRAGDDVKLLTQKLTTWTEREVEKARAKNKEDKAENIQDKTDCIMCIIDGLDEDKFTVAGLLAVIDSMFAERSHAVHLATIHKAKGLEAKRVFWLNSSQCPSKRARQPWEQQQERNLCYVATTRAMETLILIEMPQ
jgi:superfamily I DNA/RNA helicase